MITVKTPDEIRVMEQANQIVAEVLTLLQDSAVPGVSTHYLDKLAEDYCRSKGAKPAFKGYRGFPGSICASLNEEVVHGIPSKKVVLRSGDIISVDFGTLYQGFYGDSALTIPVGEVEQDVLKLLEVTEQSLYQGIEQAVIGNRVSDISKAIQAYVEPFGYGIVRKFVGHGIGKNLHEAPEIPNYDDKNASPRILEGMVFAIEPMVNLGTHNVKVLRDQWTVVTEDRKWSAHFEHSVAVTKAGPLILSSRKK